MLLAERLDVPDAMKAVLFDMDGVLVDTLSMDYAIVRELLEEHLGRPSELPNDFIRDNYAYDVPEFWRRILVRIGVAGDESLITALTRRYEQRRLTWELRTHAGVKEILTAAKNAGLGLVVVSNNPERQVRSVLDKVGLLSYFDDLVGNDQPRLRKKPAPDPYEEAARRIGLAPDLCAAVEDSLLGAESAANAGCHTVGVATGASTFAELEDSPFVDRTYQSFTGRHVELGRAGVTNKSLVTANDFVSHMVEHIAWRLGCSIDLLWNDDDWRGLGHELGRQIRGLGFHRSSGAALGVIDDGSAEVAVSDGPAAGSVILDSSGQVDLPWFVGLRCEQLRTGEPLVEMLRGLAEGMGVDIRVTVASAEDPHHTWEGVYRGVGIALNRMCAVPGADDLVEPPADGSSAVGSSSQATVVAAERPVERGWRIDQASARAAMLSRETAESLVTVEISMGAPEVKYSVDVADSISVDGMGQLLDEFAQGAGLSVVIRFSATRLNSSHVVTEDIGMAVGRALKCMAVERMTNFGIQGAGSNVKDPDDLVRRPIRAGISMEGRKFWKYVPFTQEYQDFRKNFLIGHTLPNGLFSEDLDDFIDGLAGGMAASVIVHLGEEISPVQGWSMIFRALGESVAELLSVNADRKQLAPGVKATLA